MQVLTIADMKQRVLQSVENFRTQIDSTGLFPDLKGAAGKSLRQTVQSDGQLTKSYMLMCGLSAGIAALGLLQSSTAVVIGAMLISPLMGPIASMGFGFASLDGHQIRDSVKVVLIGAAIGILTGVLLTWLSPIRNATPEIIARTEPTLLDLAIAILSGMAGAYATVQQKGATAIGVAIATALMPPLATIGYGLGVANLAFAGGALLLFLTNLAAIAFSFALIARLSGAARPLANVDVAPRYIAAGIFIFVALATPLGVTLYRVTSEARAQSEVRDLLNRELNLRPADIPQLQVKWPVRGTPLVDAVVVTRTYSSDAERRITSALTKLWEVKPTLNLQQIVAADLKSQTAAIVDAAVERSANGIARDTPPLSAIRSAVRIPTQALWVNRSERIVQIVPFAANGWGLADYRAIEKSAGKAGGGWRVRIIPPVEQELFVPVTLSAEKEPNKALDDLIWAVERWGLERVQFVPASSRAPANSDALRQVSAIITARFKLAGLEAIAVDRFGSRLVGQVQDVSGATVQIVPPPPRASAIP